MKNCSKKAILPNVKDVQIMHFATEPILKNVHTLYQFTQTKKE